jgi:hypothetical protein
MMVASSHLPPPEEEEEAMRGLVVALSLLAAPAFAADHTPWTAGKAEPQPAMTEWVELAQQGQACCKKCSKGQPCGNSCIAATAKCKQPPGCAC